MPETLPAPSLLDGFLSRSSEERSLIVRTMQRTDLVMEFARSVAQGLSRRPRQLEFRFLYDERGSELYERITEQPEYYPTSTEAAILAGCAGQLRQLTGPVSLLELGSGSSVKTDHLLRAWLDADGEARYIPVDVSESALQQACGAIRGRHPEVRVLGLNGTYEEVFPLFSTLSPLMVIFLGSSIGNFDEQEASLFFSRTASSLEDDDFFLLGVDLVKDSRILEAAYNDAAGVTAKFTGNLFARMNRELGSGLDLSAIEHVARWQPENRRIEIYARFHRAQSLKVSPLNRSFEIFAGEEILVEISRKFVLSDLRSDLERCGLRTREIFTDPRGWFALVLMQKTGKRH